MKILQMAPRIEARHEIRQQLEPRFELLFQNRVDYKDEPSLLDAAQNTANELALYMESKKMVEKLFRNRKEPLLVIDFCTGTGLFSEHILEMARISKVICVDTDDEFLDAARTRLTRHANIRFEFFNEDATLFKYNEPADLILMGSAYHHVEDTQKVQFLRNAKGLLKPNGYILVNENFLPPYSDSIESYREAVYLFYSNLVKYLEKVGTPSNAINLIRQVAWYGYNHDYEYKVSYNIFRRHARAAGLKVSRKIRVWPKRFPNAFPNQNVGSFVIVLKPL